MRERCVKSIATHEMGHALGFMHEHQRSDTPTSCEYREPASEGPMKTIGGWDLMSIMNYCYPDRDNAYPTNLSPGDIAGIIEMYPPPKVTTPAKDPPTTGEGKTTPQSEEVGDDDDDEVSTSDDDEDVSEEDDEKAASKNPAPKKKTATPAAAG